jgi:hypothetical protein
LAGVGGSYAVYEIMWKNMDEPDRPQMKIWSTCIACGINRAANTQRMEFLLVLDS